MIINGIDMREYLTKKSKLATPFEEQYPDLPGQLDAKTISISKSYLTDIALKNKALIEPILKYYNHVQTINKVKPLKNDYFANSIYDIYDISKEDIIARENKLEKDWEEQRKNRYENATSIIPVEDTTYSNFKAQKFPVIDNHSLSMFLQQTKYHIDKSFGGSIPKIGERTFIQTMFAEVDGKLKQFIRVVELRHSVQDYKNVQGVPTFDFSISVKCIPDDNLDHAQNMIRLDSKGMGSKTKSHRNELGTTDKTAYETGEEAYNHKMFEELYDAPVNYAHMHIFDRINQFINIANPISCNAISIKHLLNLSKKTYKDDSGFSNIAKDIIYSIKEDKKTKSVLNNMINLLDKSYNELNGDKAADVKQSWEDQFSALKLSLEFVDRIMNISPEKDNTIENVCKKIALGYSNEDIDIADEVKGPIEFVSGWKDNYHIKRYNELSERKNNGEKLSAREEKLLANYKDIDPEQARLAAEEQRKVIEMLENARKNNQPAKKYEKVNDNINKEIKEFVGSQKKQYVEYLIERQKNGKHLTREERNAIKLFNKHKNDEETIEIEL